jgi:hypothetical protein
MEINAASTIRRLFNENAMILFNIVSRLSRNPKSPSV